MRQGRIKALGVTWLQRINGVRDIPAIPETLPGFDAVAWFALHAPAGTPEAALAALDASANAALAREDLGTGFADSDARVLGCSVAEARAHLAGDVGRWAEVVRRTGVRVQ